jgi:hypothetical protein
MRIVRLHPSHSFVYDNEYIKVLLISDFGFDFGGTTHTAKIFALDGTLIYPPPLATQVWKTITNEKAIVLIDEAIGNYTYEIKALTPF